MQNSLLDHANSIRQGLQRQPKEIASMHFYDTRGSQLFEQICDLPEYYLTRSEEQILRQQAGQIAAALPDGGILVELGSGSARKTRFIIDAILALDHQLTYCPIDISAEHLRSTAAELERDYPALQVNPLALPYSDALAKLEEERPEAKLILWLGSSIGNYSPEQSRVFINSLVRVMEKHDRFLIGADLVKDNAVLEAAYADSQGITAAFNRNLLERFNRELGANFRPQQFRHVAIYNENEQRIEMHLESTCRQSIIINHLDLEIEFGPGERIHTENSYKYKMSDINALAEDCQLRIFQQWTDNDGKFSLSLFAPLSKKTAV
jgi:L-histidine N-alpha-methyltransferase